MDSESAPARRPRRIVSSSVREILNYFGKCPVCGYPARASTIAVTFDDGDARSLVVGTCGRPCGWNAPVEVTLMTPDGDEGAQAVVEAVGDEDRAGG
ncbi:MAG: hypothetical protein FWE39_13490 [Nocardiaceae bacterium]|nr:hypothetical protein [Nocardiaceae bacterium]